MLRIIALCIMTGSCVSLGFLKSMGLSRRLSQLKTLKRIEMFLHGEISCARTPLPDALWNIAGKVEEPFREFLRELSEDLNRYGGCSFGEVFAENVECHLKDTKLTREDRDRFSELGRSLGYLDKAMQLANLEAYGRELDMTIEELTKGLPVRKKLCQSLGIMGGLFLAILFI